jgi:hypothetical protein
VQANAHQIHRIWQFVRDGAYFDNHSSLITLRAVVQNVAASAIAIWDMKIHQAPSGSFNARAFISSTPSPDVLTMSQWSSGTTAAVVSAVLALLQSINVCGIVHNLRQRVGTRSKQCAGYQPILWSMNVMKGSPADVSSGMYGSQQFSAEKRLCMLEQSPAYQPLLNVASAFFVTLLFCFGALYLYYQTRLHGLLLGFSNNAALSISDPHSPYATVLTYNNLDAPVSLLLPAKISPSTPFENAGHCVVGLGETTEGISITRAYDDLPLWAKVDDNSQLDKFSELLVRSATSAGVQWYIRMVLRVIPTRMIGHCHTEVN